MDGRRWPANRRRGQGIGGRAALVAIGLALTLALAACGGSSTESTESVSTGGTDSEAGSYSEQAPASVLDSILHFGDKGTEAEAEAAAASLESYLTGREEKDWQTACPHLSAEMRGRLKQIGGPGDAGCGKGIEALTATASTAEGEATIAAVKGLRREGSQGYLIYVTGAKKTNAILMVLEEGEWKLVGVNPTTLYF
ncbi:MAG TPA: hypothetical protein VF245_08065 [Solirubrobacterales bacterium]